jgi:flagellar operon protein
MGYRVINGTLFPVGNFPSYSSEGAKSKSDDIGNSRSFGEVLKGEVSKKNSFTISNHAAERLKTVSFDALDMKVINEGINKAQAKGSKNCLILYKDVAMVTSIENRTIITAVESERSKENIFTNIDSVVLL